MKNEFKLKALETQFKEYIDNGDLFFEVHPDIGETNDLVWSTYKGTKGIVGGISESLDYWIWSVNDHIKWWEEDFKPFPGKA